MPTKEHPVPIFFLAPDGQKMSITGIPTISFDTDEDKCFFDMSEELNMEVQLSNEAMDILRKETEPVKRLTGKIKQALKEYLEEVS